MIVDILRHGELEGGIKYRGTLDEALTPLGRKQMDMVWQRLQQDVDHIISSPLSRCAIPSMDWAKQAGISYELEPKIAELDYGLWEGLTHAEIEQAFPSQLHAWRNDPSGKTPPQGESMDAFAQRIAEFWQAFIHHNQHQHVLLVAHSGSSRMLLAHIMGLPIKATRNLHMPYASWSRVHISGSQQELVFQGKQLPST